MDIQHDIAEQISAQFLGKTITVVVEGFDRYAGTYFGRSYMDAPDIDTKTFFDSETPLAVGDYVEVVIDEAVDYDLMGHVKK